MLKVDLSVVVLVYLMHVNYHIVGAPWWKGLVLFCKL